jgi:hypothetical protein
MATPVMVRRKIKVKIEKRLRMFANRVLGKIFWLKKK